MQLRAYRPDDVPALIRLFRDTIRTVNLRDYTPVQVRAWAPDEIDETRWRERLAAQQVVVAESEWEVVGFCSWTPEGYLDFLYVHAAFQRKGIATTLYAAAEKALRATGAKRIYAHASITAQPFFLRQGFSIVEHRVVDIRGSKLSHAVVDKFFGRASSGLAT
jgi:putative acetyltransferase